MRQYARADYGPNLSNIGAKFTSQEEGYKWLANWIKAPEAYHPKSLMPNLQLSAQDAADIGAWLLSVSGEWPPTDKNWPVKVRVADVNSREVKEAIDELVRLYVEKGGITRNGKHIAVPLSEVDLDECDMRTVVIVGSSTTRWGPSGAGGRRVFTPRWYPSDSIAR